MLFQLIDNFWLAFCLEFLGMFVSYGLNLAYFTGHFTGLLKTSYRRNVIDSLVLSLNWYLTIPILLSVSAIHKKFYGFKLK